MTKTAKRLLTIVLIMGSLRMELTQPAMASRMFARASKIQPKAKSSNAKWLLPVLAVLGLTVFFISRNKSSSNQASNPGDSASHGSIGSYENFNEAQGEIPSPSNTKSPEFARMIESEALEAVKHRYENRNSWALSSDRPKRSNEQATRYDNNGRNLGKGYCARYVGIALKRAGCVPSSDRLSSSDKPWLTVNNAADMGKDMENILGWRNLCPNRCTQVDVDQAPAGAVIVYGATKENPFGHAEINTSSGRISDFILPHNQRWNMPVKGVYYPNNPATACVAPRALPPSLAKL